MTGFLVRQVSFPTHPRGLIPLFVQAYSDNPSTPCRGALYGVESSEFERSTSRNCVVTNITFWINLVEYIVLFGQLLYTGTITPL